MVGRFKGIDFISDSQRRSFSCIFLQNFVWTLTVEMKRILLFKPKITQPVRHIFQYFQFTDHVYLEPINTCVIQGQTKTITQKKIFNSRETGTFSKTMTSDTTFNSVKIRIKFQTTYFIHIREVSFNCRITTCKSM